MIGDFEHQITIQTSTVTKDANTNEPIKSWSTWAEPFCSVEAKQGREFFENGQRFSEIAYIFKVWSQDVDGLSESMQIVFESRTFDIKGIMPDHKRRDCTLIRATEVK